MAKKTYCEEHGHAYAPTTAPGWFQCGRATHYTKSVVPVSCGAIAVCPGCLGYRLANQTNMLCVIHYQTCVLEDFPVVRPVETALQRSLSGEQLTFW